MTTLYPWIKAVAVCGACIASFGVGANDISNSFSTTIGSKALTMGTALLLAVPAELLGAILLGRRVTLTISSDYLILSCFNTEQDILAYGMMVVLLVLGIWMVTCTYYGIPVSSTQTVLGAMVGVGLCFGGAGANCIHWLWSFYGNSEEFTDNTIGVALTVISWVVSPILAALISAGLFWLLRKYVLRKKIYMHHIVLIITVSIFMAGTANAYFLLLQYEQYHPNGSMPLVLKILIPLFSGFFFGALVYIYFSWFRRNIMRRDYNDDNAEQYIHASNTSSGSTVDTDNSSATLRQKSRNSLKYLAKELAKDLNKEIFITSELVRGIHSSAEGFPADAEDLFKPAQVVCSMLFAFSHGAHAAANIVGPLATLFAATVPGTIEQDVQDKDIKMWMLCLCGAGLCAGLLLFGYNIISALGLKMAKITPTRGTVITASAYIVLTLFNRLGIPISSTFLQVGATFGVALLEGQRAVNWGVLMKVVVGFIFTTLCSCGIASVLFSQGIFSPEKQ